MGCSCGKNSFQRGTTGGVYGPRTGFVNAPRELPTPVLRQMALRKQINEQTRKQKQQQLRTVRQKLIRDRISQMQNKKSQ